MIPPQPDNPSRPVPHSMLPDIVWPALPHHAGALLLALQYQFEQSQCWPAARLRDYQFRQLHVLLQHAKRHVPFYRDRLATLADDHALDPERWSSIPVLTRAEVQQAGAALYSRELPDGHGPVGSITSSGSTGSPITVQGTRISNLFFKALNLRHHLWQRRDLAVDFCSIRFMPPGRGLPPDGTHHAGWAPGFPSGSLHGLNVFSALDDQIDWLLRRAPGYLLTYPTNALALAQRMSERNVCLPSLRDVGTFGEALSPEVRDAVTGFFGVPLIDLYSAMETGVLALQCPQHEHYHVMAENVLLEVLDQNGAPCPPGVIGRVVVTPLHNFASPLIRYEIGDLAEPGSSCDCGRTLPVLRRILGRSRSMLVLPNGERRWPGIKFSAVGSLVPMQQMQFVQRSPTELDLNLVVTEAVSAAREAKLRAGVLAMLGADFTLNVRYVDAIPRSPGGKYEDFIGMP